MEKPQLSPLLRQESKWLTHSLPIYSIEEKDPGLVIDVSPYDIPQIEKMSLLALHRGMMNYLWELVKYRDWRYSMKHSIEDEE